MGLSQSMLRREARVRGRGYVSIPQKCMADAMKQGGTADMFIRP